MIKLIPGVNDLLTCNPELAKEYDTNKNIEPIEKIFAQSRKEYWWKCSKCEYSWKQSVMQRNCLKNNGYYKGHRLQKMSFCPKCSKIHKTSFPEQALFFYIKKYFPDTINSYKNKDKLEKFELDIYIPSLNTAIEYDGSAWHKNIDKDLRKSNLCKKNNIKLIRIREKGCLQINDESIKLISGRELPELEKTIINVLLILKIDNPIVNIDNDMQKIQRQYKNYIIKKSIASNEKMLKEFSPNNLISPENISLNSNYKYLWICSKGHEYKQSASGKNQGAGCPYCSGQKVLIGFNDLYTFCINNNKNELIEEFDKDKNTFSMKDVTAYNNKKTWWICPKGHSYQTKTGNRTIQNKNCPFCANQKVLEGYNDLATTNPELLNEWDYKRNYPLTPNKIVAGTDKKVWWVCSVCNYNWRTSVSHRTTLFGRKTGCPKCAHRISPKVNQYDKNGNFIKTFDSLKDAYKALNKPAKGGITKCCDGRAKTAFGYIWKYAE